MRELKYLSKLETDKAEVKRGDDIRENFLPLIEDNDIIKIFINDLEVFSYQDIDFQILENYLLKKC